MRVIPLAGRQVWRRLASTPLLSLGSVVILALGIGSAVVMVDVLDRILLRAPAHVADPDRVARVYIARGSSYGELTGYATVEALATLEDALEVSAPYFYEPLSFGRGEHARRLETVACGPGYFSVLGIQPVLGSFADACSREDAAVISHALWRQEFGASPDVLGKPLRLGTDTYTIVGVTPRGFADIGYTAMDVWLPLAARAKASHGPEWKGPHVMFLRVVARVRPGISREHVSERATAAYRASQTLQGDMSDVSLVLGDLRPARAPGMPTATRVEVLVAAMSLVVLLVTCGNVANLLLVRGLRRERELIVKTALGATRSRLVQEVFAEAVLLAFAAGLLALAVVTTGGTLLRSVFLRPVAALAAPIDARVVVVTVIFCIVAAFLLGIAPAVRLTRTRVINPGHGTVRPTRVLDVFSGAQVALSVPMIVAAALFVLSLWNARHQDFGMKTDRVAVVTTNLFEVGRPWDNHEVHRQMEARLARLPQVEATAVVQNLPMRGATMFPIVVPGRETPAGPISMGDTDPIFNAVDPSFFSVMGMRLTQGRLFTESETAHEGSPSVAIITESAARRFWPGQSAVGKCFYLGFGGPGVPCTEVVGVIADARLFPSIRPTGNWGAAVFAPLQGKSGTSDRALLVRTHGDPAGVLATLRREAQVAAPDLPFVNAHAFDDVFVAMLRPWRLGSVVFVVFGALSMVIAAVGLAVVGAYAVTRRTREIGIRSALGAAPRHLVALVLGRSLVIVISGLTVGVALAWWSGRFLRAQLFDVTADDPRVFAVTAAGVLIIGAIAAWLPAHRAARIDPVVALRTE